VKPHDRLSAAIRDAATRGEPAIVAFMTAGFPSIARFREDLLAVAAGADVVEIGVPFTDPMADGMTIQRSSQAALRQGVSLRWILGELATMQRPAAPLVLMSYLNPLLQYGYDRLASDAAAAGVCGFIVPDLPFDEGAELRAALAATGVALVQMVTPVTPEQRLARVCAASEGFVYAVTITGAGVCGLRHPFARAGGETARTRGGCRGRLRTGRGAGAGRGPDRVVEHAASWLKERQHRCPRVDP
jgi:tryptophan synthase alpha chain